MDSIDGSVRFLLRKLALLDAAREVTLVRLAGSLQLTLVLVMQRHLDAVQRRLLRDLGAHASGADHGQPHLTEKIRVTVFTVAMLPSMPSMRSLPCTSFVATPRPTWS